MEAAGDMVGDSDCCEIAVVVAACIDSAADGVVSSDFPSAPVWLRCHSLSKKITHGQYNNR